MFAVVAFAVAVLVTVDFDSGGFIICLSLAVQSFPLLIISLF